MSIVAWLAVGIPLTVVDVRRYRALKRWQEETRVFH
jgi:hypothetical protein